MSDFYNSIPSFSLSRKFYKDTEQSRFSVVFLTSIFLNFYFIYFFLFVILLKWLWKLQLWKVEGQKHI